MSQPKPTVITELDLSEDEIAMLLNYREAAEQGSEEWFEEKLGKASASNIKWVGKRDSKGKPYQKYYDYLIKLALERVTGKQVRFSSRYIDHGKEYEAFVARLYEERTGNELMETGFLEHPELAAGASRDRLIVDEPDGCVEIKAPHSQTMVSYMVSAISEEDEDHELVGMLGLKGYEWKEYWEQMQMQMWIGKHKWCDFAVGDPDLSEDGAIWIKRVDRDSKWLATVLEPRLTEFLDKVAKLENYLRKCGIGD